MIDEAALRRRLGKNLLYGQNRLELKERVLMSKWVSYNLVFEQNQNGEANPFLQKRKEDLANFYPKNLHVAKSLETKLSVRAAREQKLFGDATDELGIFFYGTCSRIGFWSSLLRHVSSSNFDLAAKETVAQIQKSSSLDSEYLHTMEQDIKTALSASGSIIGPMDAMLTCQQLLAPASSQDDLALRSTEDLYVSQKISALPSLLRRRSVLSDDIAIRRRHSDRHRSVLSR